MSLSLQWSVYHLPFCQNELKLLYDFYSHSRKHWVFVTMPKGSNKDAWVFLQHFKIHNGLQSMRSKCGWFILSSVSVFYWLLERTVPELLFIFLVSFLKNFEHFFIAIYLKSSILIQFTDKTQFFLKNIPIQSIKLP